MGIYLRERGRHLFPGMSRQEILPGIMKVLQMMLSVEFSHDIITSQLPLLNQTAHLHAPTGCD